MSRNRIIYQSEAVHVGPSPATGFHFASGNSGANLVSQLHRVQSVNHSFTKTLTDVNQLGQLAAIDRVLLEAPVVNMDFEYIVTNVANEQKLGFLVDGSASCISGILNKTSDEKNYFIQVAPEGADAVGYAVGNSSVISIGNGFITSYSTTASVGDFPRATVNIEALNLKYDLTSTGVDIPAVNPVDGSKITGKKFSLPLSVSGSAGQATALRPGDITFSIQGLLGAKADDIKIQSYDLSFDLSREPLQKLGSRFAFSREIQFPVTVSLTVEAQVGDLQSGNLADLLCAEENYDLTITLREPACVGVGDIAAQFQLKGAKLDSQSFGGTSVDGAAKTISVSYSAQLGGPEDVSKGLFLSGKV